MSPIALKQALISTALVLGCASPPPRSPLPEKPEKELPLSEEGTKEGKPQGADGSGDEPTSETETEALPWAESTFSPRPGSPGDPDLDELLALCGSGDQALHETATWIAREQATRGDAPSSDEVRFHLHRRGAPYVMPRMWSALTDGVAERELERHIGNWAGQRQALGDRRCGVGSAVSDAGKVITVLQVDVLAELRPLPTRLSQGGFIEFGARLSESSTGASLVLLPPKGRPHSVEPTVHLGQVEAKLSLPTEGTWLVQLMATSVGGPRPVAEALVTVGKAPPSQPTSESVPGEDAYDDTLAPADALFAMVNAAREEEGLPALRRNRGLDGVALTHSRRMLAIGRISHDTGQGDPAQRIQAAGIGINAAGENVAQAQTVLRLHRVLWASPSHRENLLLRRWEEAGIGILPSEDGALYATQLFIDR